MTTFDKQYGEIVRNVIEHGYKTPDRTGTGVRKLFGQSMRFDLQKEFPAPTLKKLFFPSAVKEMLWIYQDQSNDVSVLRDKYEVRIWDEWEPEDGTIGNAYGYVVKKHDQVNTLIRGLKEDPYSRRHIMSLWDIEELPNMSLQPCAFQTIWTVTGNRLNCHLIQRSGDLGLGVPFNTAQYAVLTHMVAKEVGLEVGELFHTITDAHVYENHVEGLQEMLSREIMEDVNPRLVLNGDVKSFYDYTPEDIFLVGYDSHPHISLEGSCMISLIVAHDRERGIGRNNELPWHYPEDMKHFKETTMGHIIVMGRKTFESIGSKGLEGRTNIVLSRTLPLEQENARVVRDFDTLLKELQNKEAYIIGGEQIYKKFLHHADRAIVTEVDGTHNCDTFFPKLYASSWQHEQSVAGEEVWFHYFKKRKQDWFVK